MLNAARLAVLGRQDSLVRLLRGISSSPSSLHPILAADQLGAWDCLARGFRTWNGWRVSANESPLGMPRGCHWAGVLAKEELFARCRATGERTGGVRPCSRAQHRAFAEGLTGGVDLTSVPRAHLGIVNLGNNFIFQMLSLRSTSSGALEPSCCPGRVHGGQNPQLQLGNPGPEWRGPEQPEVDVFCEW